MSQIEAGYEICKFMDLVLFQFVLASQYAYAYALSFSYKRLSINSISREGGSQNNKVIWHKMSYYYEWCIWHVNMTYVNLADLGASWSIWTSAFTPDDWFLEYKMLKIVKRVSKYFFLYTFFKSFVYFDQTLDAIWSDFRDS